MAIHHPSCGSAFSRPQKTGPENSLFLLGEAGNLGGADGRQRQSGLVATVCLPSPATTFGGGGYIYRVWLAAREGLVWTSLSSQTFYVCMYVTAARLLLQHGRQAVRRFVFRLVCWPRNTSDLPCEKGILPRMRMEFRLLPLDAVQLYTIRCCCCCNFVRLSSCGSLQPYVKFAVPGRFAVYGLCRCCGRVACASCSTGVDKGC